jgi:hypothetical protein
MRENTDVEDDQRMRQENISRIISDPIKNTEKT